MKSNLFIIMFLLFLLDLEGQSGSFNYVHTLDEVHFVGSAGNYIEITEDIIQPGDTTQQVFVAPHFTPSGVSHPVAFVSGTKAKVMAVFSTTCPSVFYIRGRTNFLIEDDFIFASQQVTPSGGMATYTATEADIPFENLVIKCYNEFTIDWEMSYDQNSWTSIGESTNRLYVTHKQPDLTTVYHTVIDVSCHKAGGNNGPDADIINEVWEGAFEKNWITGNFPGVIRPSDNHVYTYYANAPPGTSCSGDLGMMLHTGDGRCGAWARLFREMIKVQGIALENSVTHKGLLIIPDGGAQLPVPPGILPMTASQIMAVYDAVTMEYPGSTSVIPVQGQHFLVKNWGNVSLGEFIELPAAQDFPATLPNYEIAKSDYGLSGINGQGSGVGVVDPRSIFVNHAIVNYNGKLYDPSYGVKYNSNGSTGMIALENASLDAAQGTIVRVQLTPRDAKWFFYVSKLNNPTVQDILGYLQPY